jgi:hypothetical protein
LPKLAVFPETDLAKLAHSQPENGLTTESCLIPATYNASLQTEHS